MRLKSSRLSILAANLRRALSVGLVNTAGPAARPSRAADCGELCQAARTPKAQHRQAAGAVAQATRMTEIG